jgi:hypothetical protein
MYTGSKRVSGHSQLDILGDTPNKDDNGSTPATPPDDDWTTVGVKKIEHKFDEIIAAMSDKYLPKQLPPGPISSDGIELDINLSYLMTIKLTRQKNSKLTINASRLLVAALAALQKINKTTYIAPRKGTGKQKCLLTPTQVSCNSNILKLYVETA